MTLGEFVRKYRLRLSLSQAALGARLEVDGQTISNLESGKTKTLKMKNLQRLPDALGLASMEDVWKEVTPDADLATSVDQLSLSITTARGTETVTLPPEVRDTMERVAREKGSKLSDLVLDALTAMAGDWKEMTTATVALKAAPETASIPMGPREASVPIKHVKQGRKSAG